MYEKNRHGTKLFVVDDHPVVLEGIRRAFEQERDFTIVGTSADGMDALRQIKNLIPDIVILDISLPGLKGTEVAKGVKEIKKGIRLLVYTMYSEVQYVATLFKLGARGYVLKTDPIKDLVQAAAVIRNGGTYYSDFVREKLRAHIHELESAQGEAGGEQENGVERLTAREKEIFILLADGLKAKEIARRLFISPKTVETHKYNIMGKMNISSLAEFAKIAIRKGMINT